MEWCLGRDLMDSSLLEVCVWCGAGRAWQGVQCAAAVELHSPPAGLCLTTDGRAGPPPASSAPAAPASWHQTLTYTIIQ